VAVGGESWIVDVDASTGALLRSTPPGQAQCDSLSLDPAAGQNVLVGVDSNQSFFKGFSEDTTIFQAPGGDYALFARGLLTKDAVGQVVAAPGGLADAPSFAATCNASTSFPDVVQVPDILAPNWSQEARAAGQFLQALQRCAEYAHTRFLYRDGNGAESPWLGFDGTGQANVEFRLARNADFCPPNPPLGSPPCVVPSAAYYRASRHIKLNDESFVPEASVALACHEYSHGIWHSLGLYVSEHAETLPEAKALNEGVADVLGAVVHLDVRGDSNDEPWWCANTNPLGPVDGTSCGWDFQQPERSKLTACRIDYTGTQTPAYTHCPST
jgi:hypothetical protein